MFLFSLVQMDYHILEIEKCIFFIFYVRVKKMLCLQVLEDLISQSSDKTLSDMTKKKFHYHLSLSKIRYSFFCLLAHKPQAPHPCYGTGDGVINSRLLQNYNNHKYFWCLPSDLLISKSCPELSEWPPLQSFRSLLILAKYGGEKENTVKL